MGQPSYRPASGGRALQTRQALPLIISTPCLSTVLASTQHSNRQPGAAHISPTLAHFQPATGASGRDSTSTERCAARSCDPVPPPSLFSHLPAPQLQLQLSREACLQRKTGPARADASLDSAAAQPPDAQSRHKFIRCHRPDYRKYGGILRYEARGRTVARFCTSIRALLSSMSTPQSWTRHYQYRTHAFACSLRRGPSTYSTRTARGVSVPCLISRPRTGTRYRRHPSRPASLIQSPLRFFALQSHSLARSLSRLSPFFPLPSGPLRRIETRIRRHHRLCLGTNPRRAPANPAV
ncbi:hypothetical protein V8C35DRAFT_258750 [Trichoderma chlorosporum]